MPKIRLTDLAVAKLKPSPDGQIDYFDSTVPAFGLRVGKTGKKTYFIMIRIHGKLTRITLGAAKVGDGNGLTLAAARKKAGAYMDQAANGDDPRIKRTAEKKRTEITFDDIADVYMERYARPRKRSWPEDERMLDKYVRPRWGHRPIVGIEKSDVVELLDSIEDPKTGKGKVQADRVLALVRKVFNFAIDERAVLDINPVGRKMQRGGAKRTRKRAFSDDEIKAFWNGAEVLGELACASIRMLMLTGQRPGVVRGMTHSEVDTDERTWTISGDETGRAKNSLEHIVPLSDQALALYESVPRIEDIDHVFATGTKGDKPLWLGDKLKKKMVKIIGSDDWVWNNLRGLVATKLRRPLGFSKFIVDCTQGRLDNSVQREHYDANDYLDDKRAALEAWANYLDSIVSGTKDNVVRLQAGTDENQ